MEGFGARPSGDPIRALLIRSTRHAIEEETVDDAGRPRRRLRITEGHFSPRHLLDRSRFAVEGVDLPQGDLETPRFDVAINAIACPDLHEEDLRATATALGATPERRVINPPAKVLLTARDTVRRNLKDVEGLTAPPTVRIGANEEPRRVAARVGEAGIEGPAIIRRVGTHTGQTMRLVRDRDELMERLDAEYGGEEVYVTAYVDCRGADELHRKNRAFFIDGRFHPVAALASTGWNVHSADRYRFMFASPELRRREEAYLHDPEAHLGADALRTLHDVAEIIGLDFFGIDFAVLPDGRLVLFEANAVMRHNFDHVQAFPYTKPNLLRISEGFNRMIERRASEPAFRR